MEDAMPNTPTRTYVRRRKRLGFDNQNNNQNKKIDNSSTTIPEIETEALDFMVSHPHPHLHLPDLNKSVWEIAADDEELDEEDFIFYKQKEKEWSDSDNDFSNNNINNNSINVITSSASAEVKETRALHATATATASASASPNFATPCEKSQGKEKEEINVVCKFIENNNKHNEFCNDITIGNLPSTPPSKTNSNSKKRRAHHHIDLNKSPHKKPKPKPRKKMYRPKVIGQGRPKQQTPSKPADASIEPLTPKRVSSNKNQNQVMIMNVECRTHPAELRRRRLIFDMENNSEEQQTDTALLEQAKASLSIMESKETGCQDNFMQNTYCLDTSMKMSPNFPSICKRKRIMRRIKMSSPRKNLKLSNTNTCTNPIINPIVNLPSVVNKKKKRSKGCIPRNDLNVLTKMPVLERQETKSCFVPRPHEMKKDAVSVVGNEGTTTEENTELVTSTVNSEISNINTSQESIHLHIKSKDVQGLIAESSIGSFPTIVSNLDFQSSHSERSPPQPQNFSFIPKLSATGEGMMRSCIEREPTFFDSNLRDGKSKESLLEREDLIEVRINAISQISICPNNNCAQKSAHSGHDMIGPYQGLGGNNQNENLDVTHAENGILVPLQQGQLSVINKTKKNAALEIYSKEIKAWRLQLKTITRVDEEKLDEETKKRLENERNLFHSRIQAFTACMHVIQGDRRFSPWKGSVVDSVVGVFLTQNVSDNLSSSAFMSLAAKFPSSPTKHGDCNTNFTSPVNHLVGSQLLSVESTTKDESNIEDVTPKTQETTPFGPHSLSSNTCLVSVSDFNIDDTSEKEKNWKSTEQLPKKREKPAGKKNKEEKMKENEHDWDGLRRKWHINGEKNNDHKDIIDWEAVRRADAGEIADAIKARGQHNIIADRIKEFLDRVVQLHDSIDLEWLRHAPPEKVKDYLLEFNGLGLKSVECIRLLGLQHVAFPVDTNVGRIAIRLGWVPLEPLPEELHIHLLQQYPIMDSIQKYLWPRLSALDQKTLYELHYQLITFGKVYCTKKNPNCNSCPMKGDCRHFASAYASARRALPGPAKKGNKASSTDSSVAVNNPGLDIREVTPSLLQPEPSLGSEYQTKNCEPIIEEPASPKPVDMELLQRDIEDYVVEDDPNEIPTIRLGGGEFTANLERLCMEIKDMALQDNEESRALVALAPEVTSWPVAKLKHVSRLRTKHLVYELPDSHHLLDELDRREPDDPCPYLLAIWTPGETGSSPEPSEKLCSSNEFGSPCNEEACSACNIFKEKRSNTIRGTILIPCRTAMRGSFPLNGTYFQVNEVFADHKSSEHPIDVPTEWLWNLPWRIAYFGTSTTSIFRGLPTEEIQYCFWKGFVCVRAFDRETRTPKRLAHRLHISTSEAGKPKTKTMEDE